MTNISASIHIWVKTVFINTFLILLGAAITYDGLDVLWAIMFLTVGTVATLPLLLFISPVVALSKMFTQYGISARMAWLTFYLLVMVLLFYLLLSWISDVDIFKKNSELAGWMASTMVSLVISVYINRKSLKELYEENKGSV
jgi:uncharacterized membrane protein